MRRATNIGFFVVAIGLAVFIYVRGKSGQTPPSEPAPQAAPIPVPPSPAPRLATPETPSVRSDAGTAAIAKQADHPSERRLMRSIRDLVKSDPARAEALARQARALYPDGDEADERDALLVDALINQQRIGAARSETYYYFDHHPNGQYADHLSAMTGVHPSPSGPGSRARR